MPLNQEPAEALESLLHGDTTSHDDAKQRLIELGSDAVPLLLPVLRSRHPRHRNAVALVLREIGDDAAVTPLINAIEDPQNRDNRGTLIYALQTMDCRQHFWTLFNILLTGNFEQRCMAHGALEDRPFDVTSTDLERARNQLRELAADEHTPPSPTEISELLDAIGRRSLGI